MSTNQTKVCDFCKLNPFCLLALLPPRPWNKYITSKEQNVLVQNFADVSFMQKAALKATFSLTAEQLHLHPMLSSQPLSPQRTLL